jgi:hypothetical protein
MTVILPTTPEVGLVCDELEKAIGSFLNARSTLPPLGRYESQVEALNLFYLALRDIEGVVTLARADLVSIPPAIASARAGFEASVKAIWMVDADDPYECEGRWLAHLKAVAARKDDAPAAGQAAITNIAAVTPFSGAGGLIQTTSG